MPFGKSISSQQTRPDPRVTTAYRKPLDTSYASTGTSRQGDGGWSLTNLMAPMFGFSPMVGFLLDDDD